MFHLTGGLYFEYLPETGQVRIKKHESAELDSPVTFEVITDASGWASVVSAMAEEIPEPITTETTPTESGAGE